MRNILVAMGLVCAVARVGAAQGPVVTFRVQGSWRSLAYQLPGAYRFLDRVDLTQEQQKALDQVHKQWMAEQREAYEKVRKEVGPLPPGSLPLSAW